MTGRPATDAESSPDLDVYTRLVGDLDAAGARYRLIDHTPEGRTELVSALRGHDLAQAAKCLIIMIKVGKKRTRYVLAVVPGDAQVDLAALQALFGGTYIAFAGRDRAEELAGSVTGTVLPFSYHPELELIVDPALLASPEIFFNAARLDRSIALATEDYARTAAPRIEPIAARPQPHNYAIHYEPLFTALQTIDVQALIEQVTDPWYNQTLIEFDGILVRLGVMQGEFHWHKHLGQDEFFFVMDGLFRIELENGEIVELRPQQAFTVPAGMLHRPVAPIRSAVLMIEKAGVVATGD